MSKSSRRRQPTSAPAGSRPVPPAADSARGSVPPTSTSPTGSPRVGRRERARAVYQPSFLERHRTPIIAIAALAGAVLISVFVFASASSPAYACSTEWAPSPTSSPAVGAPAEASAVQPDMGHAHIDVGDKVTYTYCPPASGSHYFAPGVGPIAPRLYGPGDRVIPQGWIHNLEHGAMVILYRGLDGDPGATEDGQAALRELFDAFPASPVCGIQPGTSQGPVIARFDDMATPYAAVIWDRILPLDDLDTTAILDYWRDWGERTNPEKQCSEPSAPSENPGTSDDSGAAPSPS